MGFREQFNPQNYGSMNAGLPTSQQNVPLVTPQAGNSMRSYSQGPQVQPNVGGPAVPLVTPQVAQPQAGMFDNMGDNSWGLWDSTDTKTGMQTQGSMSGIVGAAGAISNAYLGYQGLQEARKSREMQEKYAAVNLLNTSTAYNANVRDVAANNAAINNWDADKREQYISSNQAKTTI